jgi:hypothetical protein
MSRDALIALLGVAAALITLLAAVVSLVTAAWPEITEQKEENHKSAYVRWARSPAGITAAVVVGAISLWIIIRTNPEVAAILALLFLNGGTSDKNAPNFLGA